MPPAALGAAIGIDLGTTYSCAAWFNQNTRRPEVLRTPEGHFSMPSVVCFMESDIVIGQAAKENGRLRRPEHTVYEVKRMMGYKYDDPEMQRFRQYLDQLTFEKDAKNNPVIVIRDERTGAVARHSAEKISGLILRKIKDYASAALNKEVTHAVITVPAYFNEAQRAATKTAAQLAGLHVLKLLPEPTAAAIAYNVEKAHTSETNIMVYDFGGGTLDVTLMKVSQGEHLTLATDGDTHLGGQDFDFMLMKWCMEDFFTKNNLLGDIRLLAGRNQKLKQRLLRAAERVKLELSTALDAEIDLDSLFGNLDYCVTITRGQFESICEPLFRRCLDPVQRCLDEAGKKCNLRREHVQNIVLAGGSSRIPKIKALLQNFFNKEIRQDIDTDNAIALGAAIHADREMSRLQSGGASGFGSSSGPRLVDVVPLSVGIRTKDRNVQRGFFRNVIEERDDLMNVLIKAQTEYPCVVKQRYPTSSDYQQSMQFEIYQGPHASTHDNIKLGMFRIENLPRQPAGMVQVDVTFEIDENGCLKVSAQEVTRGIANSVDVGELLNGDRYTQEECSALAQEVDRLAACFKNSVAIRGGNN